MRLLGTSLAVVEGIALGYWCTKAILVGASVATVVGIGIVCGAAVVATAEGVANA